MAAGAALARQRQHALGVPGAGPAPGPPRLRGGPAHPGNHRDDNSWADTPRNLLARPRHLRLAADHLFGHPEFAAALRPGTLAVIGHSMGGYAALALAGGQPSSVPREAAPPDGSPQPIPTETDDRVRALVLLAPATPWFGQPGALHGVRAPILLLSAEKDALTPAFHAQIVLNGVAEPALVEHLLVANAGHFAFLTPFPAALTRPEFAPSQDPPGFDRARFQDELQVWVLEFLGRQLLQPVTGQPARPLLQSGTGWA